MTIQVDNALPPNVVEIGNEITQGVVDGLMSASPSASSSNPYITVNGVSGVYLPLAGGTMTGDIGVNYNDLNQVTSIVFADSTVQTTASVGAGTWGSITGTLSSQTDLQNALNAKLTASSNLSDLANTATARTNLGLGTMATATATDYLDKAGNLSGLANTATARTNLGLGTASTLNSSAVLQTANNLSEVTPATARTNLGLAYATSAEVLSGTSTSAVVAPADLTRTFNRWFKPIGQSVANASGLTDTTNWGVRNYLLPTASNQYSLLFFSNSQLANISPTGSSNIFAKRMKLFARLLISATTNNAESTITHRFGFGKPNSGWTTGTPTVTYIGMRHTGTGTGYAPLVLQVHNGTTLTEVTSTFTPTAGQFFDCLIDNLGNGTVNLIINGTQVATTNAGPTTITGAFPRFEQELFSTGSAINQHFFTGIGHIMYVE